MSGQYTGAWLSSLNEASKSKAWVFYTFFFAYFRASLHTIGGYDEISTEFLRVPSNAHVKSLAKKYLPTPSGLVAQIMGQDPVLMADMTAALVERGAPRIDLNCGCPSNTVVGRGAGSSLLKTPELLYRILKSMVNASKVPVSAKLRSGFADTSLFKENLLAAQEAGAEFITLHPRTKVEGYRPPANWDLIQEAKETIRIPLVGNGDILTVADALRLLKHSACDGLMIGRGAIRNPWIFHEIKAHFSHEKVNKSKEGIQFFLKTLLDSIEKTIDYQRAQVNKLKGIAQHLLRQTPSLEEKLKYLLRQKTTAKEFLILLEEALLCSGVYE